MIDLSVLYGGLETASMPHRYGRDTSKLDVPSHQRHRRAKSAAQRRPIVVWNISRTCNLNCEHCYSASQAKKYEGELTTDQAKSVIDDLALFRVPAVLFSGGEPLMRPDIFDLIRHARDQNLHVVLSTNGTLIDKDTAQQIKDLKLSYVGISLDSADAKVHDRFRGQDGAFERTMAGFEHLTAAGQKVGLRLTLTRTTFQNLGAIFDFIEQRGINRACFYHLCPSGRGKSVHDLTPAESRQAIDIILDRTRDLIDRGKHVEILTVDNHCDAAYLYLRMLRENDPRTQDALEMMQFNGGARFSSGVGIANIDNLGFVHADQFSMHRSFGNVKDRPFSQIWTDNDDPILQGLRDRLPLLKGRCGTCRFQDICGGSLRARAEILTGDPWASDPACYLHDHEIAHPEAWPHHLAAASDPPRPSPEAT